MNKKYILPEQKGGFATASNFKSLEGFGADFACFPPAGCGFHLRFPFYTQSTSVLNSSPYGDSFGALIRQPVFVPLRCYTCVLTFLAKFSTVFACPGPSRPSLSVISIKYPIYVMYIFSTT